MFLIKPDTINDATLDNTNVAENDYDAWDVSATYSINDMAIYVTTDKHWVIRSLVNDNVGYVPTGLNSDTKWVKVSETNRWKMFDNKTTSQTVNPDSIDVSVIGTSAVDSVALLNLDASSVSLTITDINSNVVYDETVSLVTTDNVYDMWTYFFAPIIRKSDYLFLNLPPYAMAKYDISITYTGNNAKCGTCVIGKAIDLGITRYNSKASSIDYSIKETDEFGDFTITERGYSRTTDITAYVEKRFTDYTVNILNQYRATPVVWVGTTEYTSTYIYGIHKNWEVLYSFPNHNEIFFQILGLS